MKELSIAAAAAIALASSPAYGATVAAGWDLAETISAGFFGQTWQGVPLGMWDFGNKLGRGLGVQNVGNADTIFLRDSTVSAGAGSTVSTGLHIEAMRLETVTPVDLAGLGLDHYFIDAGAFGILNITFDSTGNAGTFTEAWSFSFLEVRRGAADGPITPLVQQSDFTSFFSGKWSRTPPAAALTIPGVNLF